MLERFATFVIAQRAFVLIAVAALAVAGVRAFLNLPIEAFPDVQDVQVQIVTQVPGQAPEEVERAVTLPIEREMSGLPRMTQLRSVSISGLSVVTLTFADHTDDYFARQQVTEKLASVSLPPAVQPALAPLTTAVGEIYRYVLEAPPDMPDYEVRAVQDWIVRPALRMVPGVADVVSFGGTVKEYQVRVLPQQLARYGVGLDRVAQALATANGNVGGGLLVRGDEALTVRALGLFEGLDDIASTVVQAKDNSVVRVADLAEVAVGPRTRSGVVAYNERDSVVEGIVQMAKGANAATVVDALKAELARIEPRLPRGVKLQPIYDRTQLIEHTLSTVQENLLLGALLVSAILVIFLRRWVVALVVVALIPLSLCATFIGLDAMGVSANLISLGAVDFGVIIDSAVVLVEALMVKLALEAVSPHALHPSRLNWRLHALKTTAMGLARPILFSKCIIILAFLPIFTFQRVEGKIFTPVALTLSFALLGGLVLTLTFVPALLSYAVRRDLSEIHLGWISRLQEAYRRGLTALMMRRRPALFVSAALLAATLLLAPLLGTEFLPRLDEGNIWLTIALPPSASLDTTQQVERRVRNVLRATPEVANVTSHVGRPDDGTDPKGPNNMEFLADLKPRSAWRYGDKDELVTDIANRLRAIPGLPTNFSQVIQDNVEEALSGAKGEIAVKLFGPDLAVLETKAREIVQVLDRVRGATDVAALAVGGATEVDIRLRRDKLGRFGIAVADANTALNAALAGTAVSSFYEGDRRYDISLRLAAQARDSVEDLVQIPLALPAGGWVPLGDVAEIAVRQGAARITREAGGRNVIVKMNLSGRDQGSFVAEAQRAVAAAVTLPPAYRLTWGGQFENQRRAMDRLRVIVPVSLGLIFLLLFWAFNALRPALLVLAMLPFSLIGGFAALALAGLHLSVSAAVGFIAVSGIAVQNGVIMVEQVMENLRQGADSVTATVDGAVARLRPIIMTALMAGLGLMPAALSHGIGSETQRPFALVIVGGIVSATLFTLNLLPLLLARAFAQEDETRGAVAQLGPATA